MNPNKKPPPHQFDALEVTYQLVEQLRGGVGSIGQSDPDLARQLRRAASSVALNLAEGRRRVGKDRIHLFRIAEGSAAEVESALRLSAAWGYVTADLTEAYSLLGRVQAMCRRLTH